MCDASQYRTSAMKRAMSRRTDGPSTSPFGVPPDRSPEEPTIEPPTPLAACAAYAAGRVALPRRARDDDAAKPPGRYGIRVSPPPTASNEPPPAPPPPPNSPRSLPPKRSPPPKPPLLPQ